jgi:DNA (cytosine-5)-methyltransferase 1
MNISYNPLWHTLLEKNMSKDDLKKQANLTTNVLLNMEKDRNISMTSLLKICEALQCGFNEIVEVVGLKDKEKADNKDMAVHSKKIHVKSAPRLVSLFSGCGGMDKGFESAGFHRVWANDFDKDAQAVFKLNLGEIDGRDITQVPVDDIPDCDIITAGFPCQPFSNAGNRRGVYDQRGELYLECLRIIEAKKPVVVLFENVKGLLSSKHQSGKKLIDVIKEDLEKLGYHVNYRVVNASDYGVPQNRERMILVAFRNDLNSVFMFPPRQIDKTKLTLRHVLNIPKDVPNQKFWPYSPQAQRMIEQIPQGGSWKNIPYENLPPRFQKIRDNMKKYHAPNFYRRFSLDEINGTITASAQPENCGITHPIENRRYTIREIARIQTFPDDFLFIDDTLKNIVAMYKVIGNAVPCHLAAVLAEAILQQAFILK